MAFPSISIPWITSNTDYCIFRVNRSFDGTFEGRNPEAQYRCDRNGTMRFNAGVTWRITASLNCDESSTLLPSGFLTGRGETFLRDDGFAHYLGQFTIVRKQLGQPDVPMFRGTMELIGRSGSHQALGEACDERGHVEGWMIGRGVAGGPAEKYALRVAVVGESTLEPGIHAFPNAAVNRLTGTLFREP
jgi:hypothetical protein